jgi:hypothetical protein
VACTAFRPTYLNFVSLFLWDRNPGHVCNNAVRPSKLPWIEVMRREMQPLLEMAMAGGLTKARVVL